MFRYSLINAHYALRIVCRHSLYVLGIMQKRAHSQVATRVAGSTNTLCNRALFAIEQLFTYSGAVPVLTTIKHFTCYR